MEHVIELGRRQRKRQALHQAVLDSAERLFLERGIARTTVDEIAEAADVARQTVFNHFPYKEALALELSADYVQKLAQDAHALLETGAPALEVLERTAHWLLEAGLQQGETAVCVARELMHSDPDRASRAAEHVPLTHIFGAILYQAREEHAIRQDLPIHIVAKRISSILIGILAQVTACKAIELRDELAVSFDILFNGITERST